MCHSNSLPDPLVLDFPDQDPLFFATNLDPSTFSALLWHPIDEKSYLRIVFSLLSPVDLSELDRNNFYISNFGV
jgi:hypothetical protein